MGADGPPTRDEYQAFPGTVGPAPQRVIGGAARANRPANVASVARVREMLAKFAECLRADLRDSRCRESEDVRDLL
jgi:hypothetical protein